ncbi:hypothetical protein BGZ63DRAFT_359154 [Mariannaea sp. PMI_226]|nr:hypothetical protein BGZ63DRAFT_359154 [Mariannaea sp. PMI_226]
MSSRSGSGYSREREREPSEDVPPRLPSLRALAAQRDRDNTSPTWASSSRTYPRHWTPSAISRRADRIRQLDARERERNIENRDPNLEDLFPPADETWLPMSRRHDRMRSSAETTGSTGFDYNSYIHDNADSHLRLLVDIQNQIPPEYPVHIPNFSPPLRPQDNSDFIRRPKRRKLDSDRLVPSFKGFRYGKYGQVEPGQLRMEIVSCDGGMFSNETSYSAENILKDDLSVYCTKGQRCNIVLRHQGATVFTLQELVIKAPTSLSYSHPVREGMVFVSMNQDEVLSRTARFEIQYAQKANQESGEGDISIPPEVLSIQHHERGTTTLRSRGQIYCNDESEARVPQMPREFASDLPDFRVTIECSEEDDEDHHAPPFLRRGANHIGSLPFENHDSDEDESGLPFSGEHFTDNITHPSLSHWRLYPGTNSGLPRSRQYFPTNPSSSAPRPREYLPGLPSRSSLNDAAEAHAWATQEALRAVGGTLLTPHTRFNIEKHKSKCTIRFDPPVSGRFILLKMWSSHHDPSSNIDIQSVIARGFAGPRYFPSIDLR